MGFVRDLLNRTLLGPQSRKQPNHRRDPIPSGCENVAWLAARQREGISPLRHDFFDARDKWGQATREELLAIYSRRGVVNPKTGLQILIYMNLGALTLVVMLLLWIRTHSPMVALVWATLALTGSLIVGPRLIDGLMKICLEHYVLCVYDSDVDEIAHNFFRKQRRELRRVTRTGSPITF